MEGTPVDIDAVQPSLAASTPARRRAVTVSLTVDDAALERALAELLHAARKSDGRASIAAVDPARELPWTDLSFVAIDVETTGFIAQRDRVIEIAWVRFERGREVERFSSLLRVDVDVPPAVRRLTGIIPSMLAGKPAFGEVAHGLLAALASVDFAVAYNARFDRSFLAAELACVGLSLPELPWVDPLAFVRHLDSDAAKGTMPKRLVDVAGRFGVCMPSAHRAENDARATGELLLQLAPRLGARSLAELIDKQQRWTRLPPATRCDAHEGAPVSFGARVLSLFR